jgi:4-hydroxybenzoate polyprenyltransferase
MASATSLASSQRARRAPIATGAVRTLGLCLREARPVVQVMYLLRFTTGVALAGGLAGAGGRVVAGAAAWAAASFAVYLYNGVGDRAEDRRNASARPVARGDLPAARAAGVAGGAAAAAVALAATAGWLLAGLTAAWLVLGYSYSAPPLALKRHVPGEFLTGGGGSLLSCYAGYVTVAGRAVPAREALLFGVAISLWTGLVGQTKDLPDRAGDAAAGRHTLPCLVGERRASVILGGTALALAAGFAVLCALLAPALLYAAVPLAAGAAAVATALARPGRDRQQLRRPYRLFMATQYAACGTVVCLAAGTLLR